MDDEKLEICDGLIPNWLTLSAKFEFCSDDSKEFVSTDKFGVLLAGVGMWIRRPFLFLDLGGCDWRVAPLLVLLFARVDSIDIFVLFAWMLLFRCCVLVGWVFIDCALMGCNNGFELD